MTTTDSTASVHGRDEGGLARRLARRRLLVVTGKGGVGKSSVAAALGRLLASRGRRVLLLEIDPRENLHQLLGVAPSGGEVLPVDDRLALQNLKPRLVVEAMVRRQLPFRFLAGRVLGSPIFHHFAEGAPGLKELAILGRAAGHLDEDTPSRGAPDVVVLDAPATGHGVSLLAAPLVVCEVVRSGPFGHLAAELAAFVADRERCGIVVVASAEEMPVQEALELRRLLDERLQREPELLVVNGLYPPLPASGAGEPETGPLGLWARRRRINERELVRIGRLWPGPWLELPLLPHDRGPALVSALQDHLGRGLAAAGRER